MTEVDSIWKIEKDLCRCCHAEGKFKNLGISCYNNEDKAYEKYCNMLKDSFNIDILLAEGDLYPITYTICDPCISKLREAFKFRQQVLTCEQRFLAFYSRQNIQVPDSVLKKEESSSDLEEDFTYEMLTADTIEPESTVKQKESDDEDVMVVPVENTVTINTDSDEDYIPLAKRKTRAARKKGPAPKKSKKTKSNKEKEGNSADADVDAEENGGGGSQINLLDCKKGDDWHCPICDQIYKTKKVLDAHIKFVHDKQPRRHICRICYMVFYSRASRLSHQREVHNIEAYKCDACNKTFAGAHSLQNHLENVHKQGEQRKCTQCDFIAYSSNKMWKHMFKHKDTNDYQCKFCEKTFKRSYSLTVHERIHMGDHRHACQECGEAFVQKSTLNYHVAKRHPDMVLQQSST